MEARLESTNEAESSHPKKIGFNGRERPLKYEEEEERHRNGENMVASIVYLGSAGSVVRGADFMPYAGSAGQGEVHNYN